MVAICKIKFSRFPVQNLTTIYFIFLQTAGNLRKIQKNTFNDLTI